MKYYFQDVASGTNANFKPGASSASGTNSTTATTTTTTTKNTATTTTTTAGSNNNNNGAPATTTISTPATAVTKAVSCFASDNSNFIGNDIYQTLATSPDDCCNKCGAAVTATYSCKGWVYQRSTNICSLKNMNPVNDKNLDINAGTDFITGAVN